MKACVLALLVPHVVGSDTCAAKGSGAFCSDDGGLQKADLITQEVDELRTLIARCHDRIGLLEDLQDLLSTGHNGPLPDRYARVLQEELPLISEVTSRPERLTSGSADDFLISKRIVVQDVPASFVGFLPLRNPRTSSPSSTAQTALPSVLLVSVHKDGMVSLFTPSGDILHTFYAGHDASVTHLAVSPSHDEYLVATSDTTGVIRVHTVNVRQKRLSKEEKEQASNEQMSTYLGPQVNVTAQFTKSMQVPLGSDGEVPRVTALSMVSLQGTKFFVAGDAEGKVSIFTKNGTLRAKIDATVTPGEIEDLHGHLNNLLFRAGAEWGFINVEKLDVYHLDCPGFEAIVTAAVTDSQQSSRIVIADEEGTVWSLNVKDRKHCKVEHTFPKGMTRAPLELASIRGFTLGLELDEGNSTMSLIALNMSVVGRQDGIPIVWRATRPLARDWTVHKRQQLGDLIAFLSADGKEIEILELIMQVHTPALAVDSMGNFQLPVIAFAIVLVLGYQYMEKGKGDKGGSKIAPTKHDWDSADFAALRNKRKEAGAFASGSKLGKDVKT